MATVDEHRREPGVQDDASPPRVVQGQEWRACILAMIAGYADAFGFFHYRAYVSFMSGNTTQSGLNLGRAAWLAAVPTLVAIASFLAGVFVGTLLAHSREEQSLRFRFGLVAALLAVVVFSAGVGALPVDPGIALLSFAMGVMNTTLSVVGGEAVALGYVSGTLNALARHVALAVKRLPLSGAQGPWDTHQRRALLLTWVWVAFLGGAVLSTAATERLGVWVLLLPVAILTVFAVSHPMGAGE